MKTFLLTALCLLSLAAGASDLTLTNLQYKTRFELITNWCLFTNSFVVHYGYDENGGTNILDHAETIYDKQPTAYIGRITSNNIVDIYNNGVFIDLVHVSSKEIEKITITWHTNVVYGTNYEILK